MGFKKGRDVYVENIKETIKVESFLASNYPYLNEVKDKIKVWEIDVI